MSNPEKQYLIDAITMKESWRLFKILAEFVDGFETLSDIYPCVSIFGSSRVHPSDESYEKAVVIAKKLAEKGFNVMTGGGPGIMEAANKGAKEGGVFLCQKGHADKICPGICGHAGWLWHTR